MAKYFFILVYIYRSEFKFDSVDFSTMNLFIDYKRAILKLVM